MKTAIITGAYGAIGQQIAHGIASENVNLILLGRDEGRLLDLRDEIIAQFPEIAVEAHVIDLSSKKEIMDLASTVNQPIDILVNNAATAQRSRIENKDGIEMQWAVNVLGYYWMIKAFEDHLKKSEQSRIVNVASYWAGGLDLDDPEFINRSYNNDLAYRQSKQANRMMSYAFAEKYKDLIQVNFCHPGDANSKLSNDLGFGGSESARKAAETPVFLAVNENVNNISGAYFVNCRKSHCQFKNDKKGIDRLMSVCESY